MTIRRKLKLPWLHNILSGIVDSVGQVKRFLYRVKLTREHRVRRCCKIHRARDQGFIIKLSLWYEFYKAITKLRSQVDLYKFTEIFIFNWSNFLLSSIIIEEFDFYSVQRFEMHAIIARITVTERFPSTQLYLLMPPCIHTVCGYAVVSSKIKARCFGNLQRRVKRTDAIESGMRGGGGSAKK